MGLKENLKFIINEAVKEVQERSLYPELQHKTLSKSHPEGEAAYFRKEIYDLLCEIPKHTGIGNAWINSGTPKVTGDMAINYYIELSNNKFYNFESDNDFLKFTKDDFTTFLRDYYAWAKYKEHISPQPTINNELTFYDIILVEDKEKIISTVNNLIHLKSPSRKEIAIILCAMEKEGIIVIDNIQKIADVWFRTFGYRVKLKSLSNGLFEYLAGDRGRFNNENKSKIDTYRQKFE